MDTECNQINQRQGVPVRGEFGVNWGNNNQSGVINIVAISSMELKSIKHY